MREVSEKENKKDSSIERKEKEKGSSRRAEIRTGRA